MRKPLVYGSAANRLFVLLLVLLVMGPITGQAQICLGGLTTLTPPAMTLSAPDHLAKGIDSYHYCSKVGGVAFGSLAVWPKEIKAIKLSYDEKQPDGQRLKVTITDTESHDKIVAARIYDWQLIPIAAFADGDQDACFTLFGELKDKADTKARVDRGEKVLNYHPAFENTLLGLRLFQSDILLLHPDCCDLPKEKGSYILGAGESAPDIDTNRDAFASVCSAIDSLTGGPFQSYVICDIGAKVEMSAADDTLALTGTPMWQCWKSSTRDPQKAQEIVQKANQAANKAGNEALQSQFQKGKGSMTAKALREKYTEQYQRQVFEPVAQRVFDEYVSKELLRRMPDYSLKLSGEIRKQNGINPAVYDALYNTMRYTAFFRSIKAADPASFSQFAKSLSGIKIVPQLKTPTVLIGLEKASSKNE